MTVKPEEKEQESRLELSEEERLAQTPFILEEINIEELAVDGICGIY